MLHVFVHHVADVDLSKDDSFLICTKLGTRSNSFELRYVNGFASTITLEIAEDKHPLRHNLQYKPPSPPKLRLPHSELEQDPMPYSTEAAQVEVFFVNLKSPP
uniref:Uncharacterized protein n=1 Tax=Salix viminalis TaxID=40686 RepID=A0A6N2LT20_SALVM